MAPPYLYEADIWFSMIQKLKYTKVVLIYSQQEESRMVISRFQMLTEDSNVQVNLTSIIKICFVVKLISISYKELKFSSN